MHGGDKISIQRLKDYKKQLAKAFQGRYIDKGHIDSIKKKIDELERKFSLKFFYRKKTKKSITYQQISQLLSHNELYIDFAKIKDNYYIFTLNHSKKVTLEKVSITNSQIIEKNIKIFQEDINKKSYLKERGFQHIMGKLYSILLKKVDINKFNALIISPDSSLNLIPFETLYNKKDKSYLIEKVSISYIPSGRELLREQQNNQTTQEIALFAKSDFSNYSNLENLSYTIKESQNIKNIYPTARFFKEENATKENLFLLNKPKLLHLSTHGAYDIKVNNANPLLNTFIYLDQPISGLELSALNLQGTELVVLSACQTAVGKIEDAEGVSSMAKAFMEAGVNNMLVSLWFINDKASSQLMELFYLNLKKGLTHKDALRQAKLILIKNKNFNEPYLWSAMILMGKE
jgi:CHAT domain-containing protein